MDATPVPVENRSPVTSSSFISSTSSDPLNPPGSPALEASRSLEKRSYDEERLKQEVNKSSMSSLSDRQRSSPNPSGRTPAAPPSLSPLSKGDALSSHEGNFPKLTDQHKEERSEINDLHVKIASQLECYLSDVYLAEDGFLLKHVQKNRLGYVSLKLLTSFKKMKELTRDWRTTLAGACCSEVLEVNEEGTKVRRRQPIPPWLLCAPTSKTLLAWNLFGAEPSGPALEQPGVLERALRLFIAHGNVTSLRILHPGRELPAELRRHAKRHAELGRRVCAVVEFDCLEGVRRAYGALKTAERQSQGGGVCVAPLGSPGMRPCHSSTRGTAKECEEKPLEEDGPEAKKSSQKKLKQVKGLLSSEEVSLLQRSSKSGATMGAPRPPRRVQRHRSLDSPLGPSGKSSLCSSQAQVFSWSAGAGRSKCSGDYAQDSVGSPWVQRRKVGGQLRKPCVQLEVMRQPLGPNGTNGFYGNKGRGKPLQR